MDLLLVTYGLTCGWTRWIHNVLKIRKNEINWILKKKMCMLCDITSPSLMILKSDESPLPTGKITMDEASWVASLINAGGAFGTFFFGVVTNKFGRKNPLIAITIPTIVSSYQNHTPQMNY